MQQKTHRVNKQDRPNLLCDVWRTKEMCGNYAPVPLRKVDISTATTVTTTTMTWYGQVLTNVIQARTAPSYVLSVWTQCRDTCFLSPAFRLRF